MPRRRAARSTPRARSRRAGTRRRPRQRAALLERAAELVEADRAELVARCVAETGKTVPDSLAEVREAVDLLALLRRRVPSACSRRRRALPGPTGERNELELIGRGVFFCVSPWNFPLAIFIGSGRCGARGGQHRHREAGRAGHAGRGARRRAARAGRHPGRRAAVPAGRRPRARRGAARRRARRRRRVHGLGRDGAGDQLGARGARRAARDADRRDGRRQRHDRRQLGAAGAGRARRADVGVQQRGPALLGAALAVPARAHGRRDPADAARRDGRARRRRPAAARDRRRPRHRRGRPHER